MSQPAYLSRVVVRKDVPAAALRSVLVPGSDDQRTATAHGLLWTLFADCPDRKRDFLWREARPGEFYLLSDRAPLDTHGIFNIDPPQLFMPALHAGDRLGFLLRVNATVARSAGPGLRGKPCDVVMDALYRSQGDNRALARRDALLPVARAWMESRAERCGFKLPAAPADDGNPIRADTLQVLGYRVLRMDRGRSNGKLSVGVLDLQGQLIVRDPQLLVENIRAGFGRAKAFGCGLMLVRRV